MHSFLYSIKREIARGTSQTARRSLQLNHRNPVRSHRIPSDLIRCLVAAQLGTAAWLGAKSNSQTSEKHEIIPELVSTGRCRLRRPDRVQAPCQFNGTIQSASGISSACWNARVKPGKRPPKLFKP